MSLTRSDVRMDDPAFRRAVAMIDAGAVDDLVTHLRAHRHLLSARAEEDGSFAGTYFRHPRLLWFVAGNPIRHESLPGNTADIAAAIIEAARAGEVNDLQADLDYTLALVVSGKVAQDCGLTEALIACLVDHGADPNCLDAALSHRNQPAAEMLLQRGATLTVEAAAGMGRVDELAGLVDGASQAARRGALALAAHNGQPEACRILLDHGVDPNQHNPEGLHAHATPLHSAIDADSLETVRLLLEHGADPTAKDRIFGGDAIGWAEHFGRSSILAHLRQRRAGNP